MALTGELATFTRLWTAVTVPVECGTLAALTGKLATLARLGAVCAVAVESRALTAFLVTFLYVGAGLALGAALAVLLQAGRTCARTRAHAGFRIAGFLFSAWAQA